MVATHEEQARVHKAVEAVLKAQTGAYREAQQGQEGQAPEVDAKAVSSARDAA